MSPPNFRRAFLAASIFTAAGLCGCASVNESDSLDPPATPVTRVEVAPHPEHLQTPAIAEVQPVPASTDAPHAKPTAEQYEDLLARIRAGFQLGYVDEPAVRSELNWYAKHPDYLERTFGRGQRYLYHIVTEIEARKMPLELALLPVVESAFEPFGYSHARAAGLWQFIGPTGTRFGLKQNWWYDGRRDVLESTRAALDYLQFLHKEFNGDWLLAVAAYNCGEMNVHRAIRKNLAEGKPTDFWNLKLPRETRAYVPKLLAMSRLVAEPSLYGFEFSAIPNEPVFAKVDTGGQIDLKMAAELAGISNEELTYLNPGFNRWASDPDGPHHLLLPVEACELFTENLTAVPTADRVRISQHKVRSGETLASIARECGTSVAVLKQLNGLTSAKLYAGQNLLLPGAGDALHPKVAAAAARVDSKGRSRAAGASRSFHVVRSGESLWTIAQRHGVDVRTLASWNGMKAGDLLPAGRKLTLRASGTPKQTVAGNGKRMTYTVRRGDTLSDIARRFSVSVSELLSWNGLSKRQLLKPGQRLVMYLTGDRKG